MLRRTTCQSVILPSARALVAPALAAAPMLRRPISTMHHHRFVTIGNAAVGAPSFVAGTAIIGSRRHVATPSQQVFTRNAEIATSDLELTHFHEKERPKGAPVWSDEELKVEQTHKTCDGLIDYLAYGAIKCVRFGFDVLSGYLFGRITPNKILRRVLFLETVAGIPGMVAASLRHLLSLRRMQRDKGWIHQLVEEAENERMHMLTFIRAYKPNLLFRGCVLIAQGVFWNAFFIGYLISPRFCHRFVGYLEEEAVHTYTTIINTMKSTDPRDKAVVDWGKTKADKVAIKYWNLAQDATMLDIMMAVRADEANHRDSNHVFADLKTDAPNPMNYDLVQAVQKTTPEDAAQKKP